MRKNILVVIFLIVGLGGGLSGGVFLAPIMFPTPIDTTDYDNLLQDYNDLEGNYTDLLGDYDDLLATYNALLTESGILQDQFDALIGNMSSLLAILDVYQNPLINFTVPTIAEVITWLAIDDTESYTYTTAWKCGDFAAMLMVNAKAMNWRIRIACMFYSFSGEYEYGRFDEPYGNRNLHAFNVIQVQDQDGDGDLDWFYIEPQNDQVWVTSYMPVLPENTYCHYKIHSLRVGALSIWSGTMFWINHYSYFV